MYSRPVLLLELDKLLCFPHRTGTPLGEMNEVIMEIEECDHDTVSTVHHSTHADSRPFCKVIWSIRILIVTETLKEDCQLYGHR